MALAVFFGADATIEGALAIALIVIGDVAALFAAWAYLEAVA